MKENVLNQTVLCPYFPKKKRITQKEASCLELYLHLANQLAFL